MSVYAVYGHAFRRPEWALRDVFATQEEADRRAEAMVRESERVAPREHVVRPKEQAAIRPEGVSGGPPEPPDLEDTSMTDEFHGWIESVVVECESRSEVPEHLPADWIVRIVSRYGHRALAER